MCLSDTLNSNNVDAAQTCVIHFSSQLLRAIFIPKLKVFLQKLLTKGLFSSTFAEIFRKKKQGCPRIITTGPFYHIFSHFQK